MPIPHLLLVMEELRVWGTIKKHGHVYNQYGGVRCQNLAFQPLPLLSFSYSNPFPLFFSSNSHSQCEDTYEYLKILRRIIHYRVPTLAGSQKRTKTCPCNDIATELRKQSHLPSILILNDPHRPSHKLHIPNSNITYCKSYTSVPSLSYRSIYLSTPVKLLQTNHVYLNDYLHSSRVSYSVSSIACHIVLSSIPQKKLNRMYSHLQAQESPRRPSLDLSYFRATNASSLLVAGDELSAWHE